MRTRTVRINPRRGVREHRPVAHGGRYSVTDRDPGIIDFSSNVSPAGMPPSAAAALGKGLGQMQEYPDPHSSDLVSALAGYTGLPESQLAVGNGATELIYNFCNAFLAGKTALVQAPTFGEYEAASGLAGCRVARFTSMDLADDLAGFIGRIPRNGCVFVCNPNNPTGAILTARQMSKIILAAKRSSAMVFVDECFIELVPGSDESVIRLVKRHANLIVLRSLTKSFGLAGIRIGYAASSRHVVSTLNRIKVPWSVGAPAQKAGLAAIGSKRHLVKSRSMIKREAAFLKSGIAGIPGFECYDAAANFILVRTAHDSTKLQKNLLKHGVLVRDCKSFRGLGGRHIRIAVRPRGDNLRLLEALEAVAAGAAAA